MPTFTTINLGPQSYEAALQHQSNHYEEVLSSDEAGRILITSHPPTITVGRRGAEGNIIANAAKLSNREVAVVHTTRGGSVTFHGPGQVVIYPIIHLRRLKLSVRDFVCLLEKNMAALCCELGVPAKTSNAAVKPVGVWVADAKIGQIGIHVARGVTRHGLAFNVDVDLSYFDLIHPCGLRGIKVTSLQHELRQNCPPIAAVETRLSELLVSALSS